MPMLEKVDLCLTDPPYKVGWANRTTWGSSNKGVVTKYGKQKWDTVQFTKEQFLAIRQITHNQILFGANHFSELLPQSPCWIVWDKQNTGDFADCELAWASFGSAVRKFTWRWNGMIKQAPEKRYHPTQKPLGLFLQILQRYSNPNDLILDPFLGSGTTAIACERLNRRWICIEISETYCQLSKRRLELELSQPRLPGF